MYHVYWNQAAAAYSSLNFFVFLLSNFQHWNFSSHFSRELWGLEDRNLVHTWTMGRCIMCTGIRLLLLICPFISSFFFLSNFQHCNSWSHFSRELWGLEDWNLVHTWTVGSVSCIPESGFCCLFVPLFLHFFSIQFSTLKFFVTLFLGTMRPRRLKIGTLMDSGQIYHVYQIQAVAAYSSLYFFIFLSLQFSTLKFLSHFSQELWGLEDWNLVQMWIVGWCIVYTGIRLLLLIHPIISSLFFLSNYQTLKIFITFFSGTVRSRRLKLGTHMDSGQMYRVYRNQATAYLSLYFFIFLSL